MDDTNPGDSGPADRLTIGRLATATGMTTKALRHYDRVGLFRPDEVDEETGYPPSGEWLCSRVYAVLGRAEPALHHATRVRELYEEHGIGDWDLAFAHEALARAHAVAKNLEAATEARDDAGRAAEDIQQDEDRDLLLADLATIPGLPEPGTSQEPPPVVPV